MRVRRRRRLHSAKISVEIMADCIARDVAVLVRQGEDKSGGFPFLLQDIFLDAWLLMLYMQCFLVSLKEQSKDD